MTMAADAPFLSCKYIEGAVSFMRNGVFFCCLSHNGNKGWAHIMPSPRDSKLPENFVELLLKRRAEIRAQNATGVDNACKGCPFLSSSDWSKQTHLIDYIVFGHYNVCNLRCNYCYLTEPGFNEPPYMYRVQSIVDEMLASNLVAPNARIVWGGGEPTVSKEFRPITSLLLAHGCSIWVNSNAIVHSALIEEGLREGRMYVNVSVDSGTRETYHRVKAKDKFDIVWKNLARYAAAAKSPEFVVVKYIMKRDNSEMSEVDGFLDMAAAAGIKEVRISRDTNEEAKNLVTDKTLVGAAYFMHAARKRGFVVNGTSDANFYGDYGARINRILSALELQPAKFDQKILEQLSSADQRASEAGREIELLRSQLNRTIDERDLARSREFGWDRLLPWRSQKAISRTEEQRKRSN